MSDEVEESNNIQHPPWNILADHQGIKIDEKFILKLPKGSKSVNKEVKNSCKILHFSSEWDIEEVFTTIGALDSNDYPQTLIFVIEVADTKNFISQILSCLTFQRVKQECFTKLQKNLLKFVTTRPLILQLSSKDENVTKIYYKEETSSQFTVVDQQQGESEESREFSSFLRSFLNGKFYNSEIEILDVVRRFRTCSLLLRFLQTLQLSNEFFGFLALDVATKGSKLELLAALDSPFGSKGKILSNRAQSYVSDAIEDDNSVLLTAIKNTNTKLINCLINDWTHLIQQLPFEHQIKISTAAFVTNQFDVLCELLDIADYPFPKDFNPESFNCVQLNKIISDRISLEAAVKNENIHEIAKFIDENSNLKIIYNINNKSTLQQAVDASNIKVYVFLKFKNFHSTKPDENFEEAEKEAKKYAAQQRKQNIKEGLLDYFMPINSLCNKSLIHNKKISKEQEKEYRRKIRSWYKDINKIINGSEFLNVAASCDGLKIIFDFESNTVENVSLAGPTALGSTYPISKWIFIGAKLSDKDNNVTKQREQQIKGVLAHELCHYVMRLVYDNQEKPYYKHRKDMKEMFNEIVEIIDKWSSDDSLGPDDECNGIISSVFTSYSRKDFHPEVIVRVYQILSEFDDSEDKSKHLQQKYKILFEFWFTYVVPELQRCLQKNLEIIQLNGILDLLPCITKLKYELCDGKYMENMMNNKVVIVKSNVPKLLFINIRKYLQEKFGNLFDSQNIFVEPEKLKNLQLRDDFKQICSINQELRIIVDCSKDISDCLGEIFINKDSSFIFVVSSQQQGEELMKIFDKKAIKVDVKIEINYNWNDLTAKSQKLMLETKINFQNNSQIALSDLIKTNVSSQEPSTSKSVKIGNQELDEDLCEIIDVQLLNLVLENQKVMINIIEKDENSEKYFQLLFIPREFVKKPRINDEEYKLKNKRKPYYLPNDSVDEENGIFYEPLCKIPNVLYNCMPQKQSMSVFSFSLETNNQMNIIYQLLTEVKNKKFVLISDQAGNGKSWAMKIFTKILRERNKTSWVTYVDLKQFINEFKAQVDLPEFSTFMAERILKLQQKYEAKIFKNMYKNGKVFILFDGFDEIAPNYAKFVSNLVQNFQYNGGNQLWIATRDFYEIDLQKKLQLNFAYSIIKMTEEEGADLIAKSWVLVDLNGEIKKKSKEELEQCLKMSPKYESYQQKASKIIDKASISRNDSVGRPQLFKMIADGFKDVNDVDDLHGFKICIKFIKILYKRWSEQKGEIRNEASVDSQLFKLNFHKLHQYHAILSMFPELTKTFFPKYNGSEWPDDEIIACGILTKINGVYLFIHETFREFYVADAIANALRNNNVEKEVLKTLDDILTLDWFRLIRKFIFPALNEKFILEKVKTQIEKVVYFEDSFKLFFTENFENLADFAIEVLKNGDYDNVKTALNKNFWFIATNTQSSIVFSKFLELIVNYLKVDDLKKLIIKEKLFLGIIGSSLEIEIFEEFLLKIEAKTDHEFIRQGLMLVKKRSNFLVENIFFFLSTSSNLNAHKIKKFLKIINKFFTNLEIFELMSKCKSYNQNIFQVCFQTKNQENLKNLWTEFEIFFVEQNAKKIFKELVKQRDIFGQNILHSAASYNNIEIHESFWKILVKIFDNREELKAFFLQNDSNFAHKLVKNNKNPTIIEFTFKKLKENLSEAQFQNILTTKGFLKMNLLQTAAYESKVIEIHQLLWKLVRNHYETAEKFLEMIKEVNAVKQNILNIALEKSSREIFEFMIQELEKIASRDEIRQMLKNLNNRNQNLLQTTSERNESLELHKILWQVFRKYFKKSEILEFIKHVDCSKNNILFIAVKDNTKETVEHTWNEIKKVLNYREQVEYLKIKGKDGKNLIQMSLNNIYYEEEVKAWIQIQLENYKIYI